MMTLSYKNVFGNVNPVTPFNFSPNASILQGAKTHLVNTTLLVSSGNY